ncbi:hypothetical protein LCGC14_1822530 [marine sediment metagenome]|uniref:Gene product 88 domain-containing protein n=1 Tax=marine sediment metagenome TaxID=412755 RepID=A0A0F9JHZ0_9ZZZZ
MKLLTQNSKLKKDNIWSFGLPAVKTCPQAGECANYCYARKGRYVFGTVKSHKERCFDHSKTLLFIRDICREIDSHQQSGINIIRIHDSGDFYNRLYARQWFAIAKRKPNIIFYAYTKSVEMFKEFRLGRNADNTHVIPDNFRVIYSYGGKQDQLIDINLDRHAWIFDNEQDLRLAGYVDCSESDLLTATTDSLKIGLIYR